MKKYVFLYLTSFCFATNTSAESIKFDTQRGCEIVAQGKKTQGMDSVHAAYCVGLLDGALGTKLYEKTAPNALPRICPPAFLPTEKAAAAVAEEMKREAMKKEGAPRGFNEIFALALSYPCPKN